MWSNGIIIEVVLFKLFPGLVQGKEDLSVQQLIAELAVDGLDVSVFSWFTGTDKVEHDAMAVSPGVEDTTRKLRSVVDGDCLGKRLADEDGAF